MRSLWAWSLWKSWNKREEGFLFCLFVFLLPPLSSDPEFISALIIRRCGDKKCEAGKRRLFSWRAIKAWCMAAAVSAPSKFFQLKGHRRDMTALQNGALYISPTPLAVNICQFERGVEVWAPLNWRNRFTHDALWAPVSSQWKTHLSFFCSFISRLLPQYRRWRLASSIITSSNGF